MALAFESEPTTSPEPVDTMAAVREALDIYVRGPGTSTVKTEPTSWGIDIFAMDYPAVDVLVFDDTAKQRPAQETVAPADTSTRPEPVTAPVIRDTEQSEARSRRKPSFGRILKKRLGLIPRHPFDRAFKATPRRKDGVPRADKVGQRQINKRKLADAPLKYSIEAHEVLTGAIDRIGVKAAKTKQTLGRTFDRLTGHAEADKNRRRSRRTLGVLALSLAVGLAGSSHSGKNLTDEAGSLAVRPNIPIDHIQTQNVTAPVQSNHESLSLYETISFHQQRTSSTGNGNVADTIAITIDSPRDSTWGQARKRLEKSGVPEDKLDIAANSLVAVLREKNPDRNLRKVHVGDEIKVESNLYNYVVAALSAKN